LPPLERLAVVLSSASSPFAFAACSIRHSRSRSASRGRAIVPRYASDAEFSGRFTERPLDWIDDGLRPSDIQVGERFRRHRLIRAGVRRVPSHQGRDSAPRRRRRAGW
jgi:hypothetical protein